MSLNQLAQNIINEREARNWSQAELARRVNLDNTIVNKIEKGTRKVSSEELKSFASAFHISMDKLAGNEKDSEISEVDLKKDPTVLSYGGRPVSKEDMDIIKAILERHFNDK